MCHTNVQRAFSWSWCIVRLDFAAAYKLLERGMVRWEWSLALEKGIHVPSRDKMALIRYFFFGRRVNMGEYVCQAGSTWAKSVCTLGCQEGYSTDEFMAKSRLMWVTLMFVAYCPRGKE